MCHCIQPPAGSWELLCPAHSVLGHVPAVKPGAFYSRPSAARWGVIVSLLAGTQPALAQLRPCWRAPCRRGASGCVPNSTPTVHCRSMLANLFKVAHSCSPPSRQAELDSLRAGKAKPSGRLGGLGGGSRLVGGGRLGSLGGSTSRLAGSKRGGLELQPVRRSRRTADKRVRCGGSLSGAFGATSLGRGSASCDAAPLNSSRARLFWGPPMQV